MDHPMIVEIERTGYPLDSQPEEHHCDSCGDFVEGDVFEYDGYIYCGIACLTRDTDVQFGNIYEFK